MSTLRLQVYQNECGACSARFESFHGSPHDYGVIPYSTEVGEMAFLSPDEDPVWEEVSDIVAQQMTERSADEVERARVFHAALTRSLDPSPSGRSYYAWGMAPCPRCGSLARSHFGPVDPARFVDVEETAVSHRRWEALSPREKEHEVGTAIREYLESEGPVS